MKKSTLIILICVVVVGVLVGFLLMPKTSKGNAANDGPFYTQKKKAPKNLLYPIKNGDKYGYIDRSGEMVINPQFDAALIFIGALAPFAMDEKWGFIDRDGKWVINPQFESALFFKDGLAPVELEDKWGYVDKSGKLTITPQFDSAYLFHNGSAAVRSKDKWGFIDTDGKYLINPQYDKVEHIGLASIILNSVGDLIPVSQDDKWGYIDDDGKFAINPQFERAEPFINGIAVVKLSGKYGYIGTDGEYLINPQFERAESFTGSLAAVASNEDNWGYIDQSGKYVINPHFDNAEPFFAGLAAVKKDDKWGYIDENGKFVINPQFKSAESFFFGELAQVRIDDDFRRAYINKKGKIVWLEDAAKAADEQIGNNEREKLDRAGQLFLLRRENNNLRMKAAECLELVALELPVSMTLEELKFDAGRENKKNLILQGFVLKDMVGKIDEFRTRINEKKTKQGKLVFSGVRMGQVNDALGNNSFKVWDISCELNIDRRPWKELWEKNEILVPADLPQAQDFDPVRLVKSLNGFGIHDPVNLNTLRQNRHGFDACEITEVRLKFRTKPYDLILFLRELADRPEMICLNRMTLKPVLPERKELACDMTIVACVFKR